MTWRADWGGSLLGRGATKEEAQAFVKQHHFHALVMNEEDGDRFIYLGAIEGWLPTVAGRLIEPPGAKLSDPDHWRPLRKRADTDGDVDD